MTPRSFLSSIISVSLFCLFMLALLSAYQLYALAHDIQAISELNAKLLASLHGSLALRMLIVGVVTGFFAVLLLLVHKKQPGFPVQKLLEIFSQVRDGEYHPNIPSNSNAENSRIFDSLALMTDHIAKRDLLKKEKIDTEKSRFKTLADYLNVPIILLNDENRIVFANDDFFELFRLTWEDVYETELKKVSLPPQLIEKLLQWISEGIWPENEPLDLLGENYAFELQLTLLPIKDHNGAIESVICLFNRLLQTLPISQET